MRVRWTVSEFPACDSDLTERFPCAFRVGGRVLFPTALCSACGLRRVEFRVEVQDFA